MTILQAIFLGFLQGVTEFLPVSSSGHLVFFRAVMRIEEIPVLFDVLLHLATLVAIVLVFRKRILSILVSLGTLVTGRKRDEDKVNLRLFLILMLGTVFTGVLGLVIAGFDVENYPKVVSLLFLVTAAILILARFSGGETGYGTLKPKHGIITGLAQGLGVLPGISRSGITISAALFSGMTREKAGEFSFLISIPAILGALLLEFRDVGDLFLRVSPAALVSGVITAFVVGLLSLLLLLRLIRKGRLYYFSFYLIPLGLYGLFFL